MLLPDFDRGDAVGIQVEGIDHVHIIQVGSSGFISQIYRVIDGKIPDGEGLELGIACGDATLMLVVQLAQTGGQLAAAWAGSGDHHQGTGGFDIIISAKTILTDDMGSVVGITFDVIVVIDLDTQSFQPGLESFCQILTVVAGQNHTGYIQSEAAENINEPYNIPVIGNAQVTPLGRLHFC